MIEQDKQSWNRGRANAMLGNPSKWPRGLDALVLCDGRGGGVAACGAGAAARAEGGEETGPFLPRTGVASANKAMSRGAISSVGFCFG
jgi:hypothetical protein